MRGEIEREKKQKEGGGGKTEIGGVVEWQRRHDKSEASEMAK